MNRIPVIPMLAALWAVFSPVARGHEDPAGDIYPKVTVVDGNFSIVFNRTTENGFFQTIYSPGGELLKAPHAIDKVEEYSRNGPVGLYGEEVSSGDKTLVFKGDKQAKPGYLQRSADGTVARVELPWPKEVSLTLFEAVAVTKEGIAITGKENRKDLKFYWFPFGSKAAPTILDLGATDCIYDFPVASNPAFAGGKFHVAFMRTEKDSGTKLYLWSWKPGDREGKEVALDSPGFWNSHLSMAAIGDRLCLAYHCQTFADPRNRRAKIITIFRKAE